MRKRALALATVLLLGGAARAEDAPGLVIAHAGSLTAALKGLEEQYTRQTGVPVEDIAGGSVGLARQLAAGRLRCDLYGSADFELIVRMLKPAGLCGPCLRIAAGAMVLAYTTESRNAATIAAPGPFHPPEAVPAAAPDWYLQLAKPGVRIAGAHPFLDPGGYRADLIFQLAQDHNGVPNLYNDLLSRFTILNAPGGLGKAFDYMFIYEHGALNAARADTTGSYRYVRLPDEVNLGAPAMEERYRRRGITIPGLQVPGAEPTVTIPAGRVTWGITVMANAVHREQAEAFLQLLCGAQGAASFSAAGQVPIAPPVVSRQDAALLPASLRDKVRIQ